MLNICQKRSRGFESFFGVAEGAEAVAISNRWLDAQDNKNCVFGTLLIRESSIVNREWCTSLAAVRDSEFFLTAKDAKERKEKSQAPIGCKGRQGLLSACCGTSALFKKVCSPE
jgi:hypothetical protein